MENGVDILIECPECGHPIDSWLELLNHTVCCPECDNNWILTRADIIDYDPDMDASIYDTF